MSVTSSHTVSTGASMSTSTSTVGPSSYLTRRGAYVRVRAPRLVLGKNPGTEGRGTVPTTHLHTCTFCEATCGVVVTVEDGRVPSVRGDKDDPLSAGYLCAKGPALADVHHDPDRLRRPLVRAGDGWREVGWDEAFDLVASRLKAIQAEHGRDAVAVYYGNPTAHSLGLLTYGQVLFRALRTRNRFSATSVDQLPHMLAGLEMLGHQLLLPVPDLDRTDLFVCIGANPAASNGSLMTAPNVRGRMKAIAERGGRVVLLDPRRTESAAVATEHHFVRPGTDALLLLSIVHELFAEDLVRPTLPVAGMADLQAAAAAYAPEVTAPVTGVDARRGPRAGPRPRHDRAGRPLRPGRGLDPGVREPVHLADRGDQRADRAPRHRGRLHGHVAGDRHGQAHGPWSGRLVRRPPLAGARAAGVQRRAAGRGARRGDRDARARARSGRC